MAQDRILVLCVDRDADIRRKIGEKGPLIGRANILDAAMKLGLADPTEADMNALFQAAKVADDLKMAGKTVEVAALIGDEDVGITSDVEIAKQLDEVGRKFESDGLVFVSDGAEDEHVLPILQSKAKIISVRRVVVRQSEPLENTYYVLHDFLKDVVGDPKLSRVLLGLPGIAAILYMLLGQHGWRLIVGVTGVFLFIKGFNLEGTIQRIYNELRASLVGGRVSFFTYVVAAMTAIVGVVVGYDEVRRRGIPYGDYIISVPTFISESVNLLMLSAIVALSGKSIDAWVEHRSVGKYLHMMIFTVALRFILDAVSLFLLKDITLAKFSLTILFGLALSIFSFSYIMVVRSPTEAKQ